MRRAIRYTLVLPGLAIWLVLLVPFQMLALVVARAGWKTPAVWIPILFHRGFLHLVGIRLKTDGRPVRQRPLLIVANHVSWLDIPVLGAIEPLSFIAKSDMETWPLFGSLAKLQRTIFVQRERRREAGDQASAIAARMTEREVMVLFPEGTTGDGNGLLPFKTPLFEAAKLALADSDQETATVQPCAIVYSHIHGLPITRSDRTHVAWPGEIGLGESLFGIIRTGALDVTVRFAQPIALDDTSNRKAVAAEAAGAIRRLLTPSGS